MGREFPLTPRDVPKVATKHRRIVTAIPAPASISRLEQLRTHEPATNPRSSSFRGLANRSLSLMLLSICHTSLGCASRM